MVLPPWTSTAQTRPGNLCVDAKEAHPTPGGGCARKGDNRAAKATPRKGLAERRKVCQHRAPCRPRSPRRHRFPGDAEHEAFIAPGTVMHEFTWRAVIMGTFLGMIFGASSLFLTLKVGLTVSASIPVAVISLDHLPRDVAGVRVAGCDHFGAQHHPDRRERGGIHRVRRGRDDARHPDFGFRPGTDAGGDGGDSGRVVGDSDDDPAAAGLDRQGARGFEVPRGDGVRGGAEGGGVGGGPGGGVALRAGGNRGGAGGGAGGVARGGGDLRRVWAGATL